MSEQLFTYVCKCKECGEELNRAEHVPESDQLRVALGAPLMVGKCPKGCRSTWSDCNLRYTGEWVAEVMDDLGGPTETETPDANTP